MTDLRRRVASRRQNGHSVPSPPAPTSDVNRLVVELQDFLDELENQDEELRRLRSELSASEARHANLYDNAPVGYLTLNASGTILKTNQMAAALLGQKIASIPGSLLADHCDENSVDVLHQHLRCLQKDTATQYCELQLATKKGIPQHVRLDSNSFAETQGNDDQWHCRVILTDVSKRKNAIQNLMENDCLLRTLTNAFPALIGYVGDNHRFHWVNSVCQDWFGMAPNELIGQHIGDVVRYESKSELERNFAISMSGRQFKFESKLDHWKLGLRNVQIILIPDITRDGETKGIHTVCLDTTDQIAMNLRLERRQQYEANLNRLTPSEKAVYDLLIRGKANKFIALQLDIGLRTAERRRRNILTKMNAESMAELFQKLAKSNQ